MTNKRKPRSTQKDGGIWRAVLGYLPHVALTATIGIGSAAVSSFKMSEASKIDLATRRTQVDAQFKNHEDRIEQLEKAVVPRTEINAKDRALTDQLTELNQRSTEVREDVRDLRALLNQLVVGMKK